MTLYHASQNNSLKLIKPQRTLSNDKYIGDFVFATANKALAAMYLVPKGFAILMDTDLNPPVLVVCGTKQDLQKKDKGGAIYELPDDTFEPTPQSGLELYEKVSTQAVVPLKTYVYKSIFDAFEAHNIVVKFVDESMFKSLVTSPKQQELIQKL